MNSMQGPGNAPAGSNSIAETSRHKCPQCEKTFKHTKHLNVHIKGHELRYQCRFCPERFARSDQAPRHELLIHGRNVSGHICYIPACSRLRLGMKSEALLIQHLQQSHDGATMAENEKAKLGSDQAEDDPIVGHESKEDSSMGSPSTDDNEENSDEEVTALGDDMDVEEQELTSADYKAENKALREQLRQEREWHRIEIDAIRKAYKAQIEDMKARIPADTMENSQKE